MASNRKTTGTTSAGSADKSKTSQKVSGTGMGSEAAEGLNAVGGRSPKSPSAAASRETGRGKSGSGIDRAGSEPLGKDQQTHKGGYGGDGGAPRTSSDQRPKPGDSRSFRGRK